MRNKFFIILINIVLDHRIIVNKTYINNPDRLK